MAAPHKLQAFLDGAHVATEVFALRPDYRALLMAVDGIKPAASDEASESLLQEAESTARAKLAKSSVTELPHIAAWREAFKAFGAKPNKTRNSLEALTRRVDKGLPRINRITDLYNAVSIKYQIPFGGEDLDKYERPPRLIRATGKEDFKTTASGETVMERPDVGEVVWMDGNWITCRHWNWRQSPRTALTDETTRALFILDALAPVSDEELEAAADELASALQKSSPGVEVVKRILRNDREP